MTLPPGAVQFRPEIEPLVRLLEETPRERIFDAVAGEERDVIGDGRYVRYLRRSAFGAVRLGGRNSRLLTARSCGARACSSRKVN